MHGWTDRSDAELLAATREHPDAFGVFYRRHARVVDATPTFVVSGPCALTGTTVSKSR